MSEPKKRSYKYPQWIREDPSIQNIASWPDEKLAFYEKIDPLRAQIIKDCRAAIAPVNENEVV